MENANSLYFYIKKYQMEKETGNSIELQFLSEPSDVNFGGKVHGGMMMKWIDQAAYACAVQWSESYCVTVYVGGIRFYHPVHIGHLVRMEARIIYTGKTSMHIAVDAFSKPVGKESFVQNTHCVIVFVALDEQNKPKEVPVFIPKTEKEMAMNDYAVKLMDLRKSIEEEMRPYIS
jgi:acyl-CoA hydrolase